MHRFLFAVLAGALTVAGFAPFGVALLPIVTLAGLFVLWRDAVTPKRAAGLGFAFGAGLFGAGVPWIGIALVSLIVGGKTQVVSTRAAFDAQMKIAVRRSLEAFRAVS